MPKKLLTFLFAVILTFNFSIPVKASTVEIEYLPDGSYIVSELSSDSFDFSTYSSTVTRTKTSYYYNASGVKSWSVSVTGTFTYGNGSSSCKSSTCKTAVYNNSWSVGSQKASKSGNKATASAVGEQYSGGYIVQSITRSVTLTCSSTGQFS